MPGGAAAIAKTFLHIHNEDVSDASYVFGLVDPTGTLAFEPPSGFTVVGPGETNVIEVTIIAPPAGTPGTGIAYRANVVEMTTGAVATVNGELRNTDEVAFSAGGSKQILPEDQPESDGGTTNKSEAQLPPKMLSGKFEGDPFRTVIFTETITLGPRETHKLTIPIDLELFEARGAIHGFGDLVIEWDQDGDGFPDPGGSITLCPPMPNAGPTCPGDFNNDGDVDGADLGQMLGNWGACPE